MNYAEQITAFEAKRASTFGRMETIMQKAAEAGTTLDAAEQEEYDGAEQDLAAIDSHLKRLRTLEGSSAVKAVPVAGYNPEDASTARGGERVVVKAQPKLEPGFELARMVKCMVLAGGDKREAIDIAKSHYGDEANVVGALQETARTQRLAYTKAAVPAGSTADGNWASDLITPGGAAFADFREWLRPQTIVGRFGVDGIPALRRVPFRAPLGGMTAGGTGHWVGEGEAKPLTNFGFDQDALLPLKVAAITALTEELIQDAGADAEQIIRDGLRDALVETIDVAFIDPTNAGATGVKPASITNGVTSVAASGTGDADDVRLDIRSLVSQYINSNNRAGSLVLVMNENTALALGMMVNALGQAEFNGIGTEGGRLFQRPVITSQHVGDYIVAVNASDVYYADTGDFDMRMSREASLLMADNPAMSSDTPTAAQLVSMFQTNSAAFLAERRLNWKKRRAEAVQVLRDVAWGGAVTAPSAEV